jgi:hypothetical protein
MMKKILLYDIETTPNISYTWGMYEQNVLAFVKEWELLTFAWKWLGEKKINIVSRRHPKTSTDKAMAQALKDVLEQADIVVSHNGMSFDDKKTNAKFIQHDLGPVKPYISVDTKRVAKRKFMFNSNSLDNLGKTLKVGRKLKHPGFSLWEGCMAGDKKSFSLMERYNKQDVELLEKIYLKLRPWMDSHPSVTGKLRSCPKCGSKKVKSRGRKYNKTTTYQILRCEDCKGFSVGDKVL